MGNIYVKLGWPEYQTYQQFDGFDEHSHYCPEDEVYFIEQDWLMEQDGQEKLVDKLQEAIDACIKGGISIDFDYCSNSLNCFNIKDIKEFGYCPQIDEETEESYCLDISRAGRSLKHIGDYNTEDGDLQFVIKKSTKK